MRAFIVLIMQHFVRRISQYVSTASAVGDHISGLGAKTMEADAREHIIETGEPTRSIYILQKGWAVRYRSVEDGCRQILNFMLPGDIFDLQALADLKADHDVATVTQCKFLVIDSHAFLRSLRQNGEVATAFWWAAVQEESILREQLLRVGRLHARERIGHLLLELRCRMAVCDGHMSEAFDFPISRVDIADALGLTPVHVSRCMRSLRERQLVEESGGRMKILDARRLAEQSYFSPDYLHARRLNG